MPANYRHTGSTEFIAISLNVSLLLYTHELPISEVLKRCDVCNYVYHFISHVHNFFSHSTRPILLHSFKWRLRNSFKWNGDSFESSSFSICYFWTWNFWVIAEIKCMHMNSLPVVTQWMRSLHSKSCNIHDDHIQIANDDS